MAILNSAQLNASILNPEGEKTTITIFSNTQRTNQVDKDVVIEKSAEKNWALPKDEILVKTKIVNNMDTNLEDFHFIDTLSQGATFVEGSVVVGSEEKIDLNPIDGFDLAVTIGALGGECEIKYKIRIDEHPQNQEITLFSTIDFTLDNNNFVLNSNTTKITIIDNDIYILKSANTNFVKSGDQITYTIVISNNGNIENTNLFFMDNIPASTTFIPGSVKINSVENLDANPLAGFSLDDLPAQDEITIEFKVQVN